MKLYLLLIYFPILRTRDATCGELRSVHSEGTCKDTCSNPDIYSKVCSTGTTWDGSQCKCMLNYESLQFTKQNEIHNVMRFENIDKVIGRHTLNSEYLKIFNSFIDVFHVLTGGLVTIEPGDNPVFAAVTFHENGRRLQHYMSSAQSQTIQWETKTLLVMYDSKHDNSMYLAQAYDLDSDALGRGGTITSAINDCESHCATLNLSKFSNQHMCHCGRSASSIGLSLTGVQKAVEEYHQRSVLRGTHKENAQSVFIILSEKNDEM